MGAMLHFGQKFQRDVTIANGRCNSHHTLQHSADFLNFPLGEEVGEQFQALRKPPDAHSQVVDFVRPGFLGGAMHLKRQRRQQPVHLVHGVIMHTATARHGFARVNWIWVW